MKQREHTDQHNQSPPEPRPVRDWSDERILQEVDAILSQEPFSGLPRSLTELLARPPEEAQSSEFSVQSSARGGLPEATDASEPADVPNDAAGTVIGRPDASEPADVPNDAAGAVIGRPDVSEPADVPNDAAGAVIGRPDASEPADVPNDAAGAVIGRPDVSEPADVPNDAAGAVIGRPDASEPADAAANAAGAVIGRPDASEPADVPNDAAGAVIGRPDASEPADAAANAAGTTIGRPPVQNDEPAPAARRGRRAEAMSVSEIFDYFGLPRDSKPEARQEAAPSLEETRLADLSPELLKLGRDSRQSSRFPADTGPLPTLEELFGTPPVPDAPTDAAGAVIETEVQSSEFRVQSSAGGDPPDAPDVSEPADVPTDAAGAVIGRPDVSEPADAPTDAAGAVIGPSDVSGTVYVPPEAAAEEKTLSSLEKFIRRLEGVIDGEGPEEGSPEQPEAPKTEKTSKPEDTPKQKENPASEEAQAPQETPRPRGGGLSRIPAVLAPQLGRVGGWFRSLLHWDPTEEDLEDLEDEGSGVRDRGSEPAGAVIGRPLEATGNTLKGTGRQQATGNGQQATGNRQQATGVGAVIGRPDVSESADAETNAAGTIFETEAQSSEFSVQSSVGSGLPDAPEVSESADVPTDAAGTVIGRPDVSEPADVPTDAAGAPTERLPEERREEWDPLSLFGSSESDEGLVQWEELIRRHKAPEPAPEELPTVPMDLNAPEQTVPMALAAEDAVQGSEPAGAVIEAEVQSSEFRVQNSAPVGAVIGRPDVSEPADAPTDAVGAVIGRPDVSETDPVPEPADAPTDAVGAVIGRPDVSETDPVPEPEPAAEPDPVSEPDPEPEPDDASVEPGDAVDGIPQAVLSSLTWRVRTGRRGQDSILTVQDFLAAAVPIEEAEPPKPEPPAPPAPRKKWWQKLRRPRLELWTAPEEEQGAGIREQGSRIKEQGSEPAGAVMGRPLEATGNTLKGTGRQQATGNRQQATGVGAVIGRPDVSESANAETNAAGTIFETEAQSSEFRVQNSVGGGPLDAPDASEKQAAAEDGGTDCRDQSADWSRNDKPAGAVMGRPDASEPADVPNDAAGAVMGRPDAPEPAEVPAEVPADIPADVAADAASAAAPASEEAPEVVSADAGPKARGRFSRRAEARAEEAPVPSADVRSETLPREPVRPRRRENPPVELLSPEEPELRSPEEAYRHYAKPLDRIGTRLILTGLLTMLSLFLTLYLGQGWSFLPEIFSGGTTAYILLALLLGMVLVNRDLYLYRWRREKGLRPELLLVLATVFTALDSIQAAQSLRAPFTVVVGALLLIELWGRYDRGLALITTLKVLREEPLYAGVSEVQDITRDRRGLVRTAPDVESFMEKLETRDLVDRIMGIYTPAAAVGGLILTLLISIGLKQNFLWTGALVFLGSIPVTGLLAFPRLFALLAARLAGTQAALCGYHGAEVFGGEHSILIGDDDIFPAGSLTLNGFKVYNGNPDRLIAYAAAAARSSGSALHPLFEDLLVTHNGRRFPVDEFRFYDSGGIGASIQQDVVLLGSLEFMRRMGVHMDRGAKVKQAVYMSLNGELAAVFAIRYTPPENLRRGLAAIAGNRHFKGILVTRTFLGTPGFLKARFGVPTSAFSYPSTQERIRLSEAEIKRSGAQGAILARDSFSGFAQAAAGGRMLRSATLGAAILAVLGGLLGLILMGILAALPAYETATALNMLLYTAAWLAPTLLLTSWARHF